jgi:methylenetetrahydrofolate reductase (NADPH)
MKIIDIIKNSTEATISFEFFPPKNLDSVETLHKAMNNLQKFNPSFVSVTHGAGGSTRGRTLETVKWLKNEIGLEAMAHLTCVGSSGNEITNTLRDLVDSDIDNILALRGDVPADGVSNPTFEHAIDLVRLMNKDFSDIGNAANWQSDLRYLKEKVDNGVDFLVTQLFFDNKSYNQFVKRAQEKDITVPIIPGIMPITSVDQIQRISKMCGAKIPPQLLQKLKACNNQKEEQTVGLEWSIEQCQQLLEQNVPGIHFYTMNKSESTENILLALQ